MTKKHGIHEDLLLLIFSLKYPSCSKCGLPFCGLPFCVYPPYKYYDYGFTVVIHQTFYSYLLLLCVKRVCHWYQNIDPGSVIRKKLLMKVLYIPCYCSLREKLKKSNFSYFILFFSTSCFWKHGKKKIESLGVTIAQVHSLMSELFCSHVAGEAQTVGDWRNQLLENNGFFGGGGILFIRRQSIGL